MKIIRKQDSIAVNNSTACSVTEYPLDDSDINIAIATINGRYPDHGWAVNTQCKEIGLVLHGSGTLTTEHTTVSLAEGDVVLIEINEKYFWQGTMKLVLPATPAWHPQQHAVILD